MPVFPGLVRHNNASSPIIDVTQSQIKGLGLFGSISDRRGLSPSVQTGGFLAVTQVDSTYKAFVYTGDDWNSDSSWTEIGSIPGGSKHSVLSKLSDLDSDYDWTETPQFEAVSITKNSEVDSPSINLFRSRGSEGSSLETQSGDVIAQVAFFGSSVGGQVATAGKMVFTQVDTAGYGPGLSTKMELFVGNESGDVAALTLNEERVVSIARQTTPPTPVAGGLYADSSNRLFFGVEN